jgi:hypothetical protein
MSKESELTRKIVKVYEDPVTRQKFEGDARVVKVLATLEETEAGTYYQLAVGFEDEGEIYTRTVFVEEV